MRFSVFNQPATLDAQLADSSCGNPVASSRNLAIANTKLPPRPDFGVAGTSVKLRTNFFPLRVPRGPLYEYSVVINPSTGTSLRRVKKRIFQLAETTRDWTSLLKGRVAHDHVSRLVSAQKLPQPLVLEVPLYREREQWNAGGEAYTLTINYVRDLDMQILTEYISGKPQYRGYNILPIIAALNMVLASHGNRPGPDGGVLVGRNRYFWPTTTQPMPLGGGLEAWRGFSSSVRPTFKQLMVNVNVFTTAFYTPGNLALALDSFMKHTFNARPNDFVRGLRVKTTHLGNRRTVKRVTVYTASTYRFNSGFGYVTVEQYFKQKYDITLHSPDMPLVDVGRDGTPPYLPPELYEILPGQSFRGNLSDENAAAMIKAACHPPHINADFIMSRGLDKLGFKGPAPPLEALGISIGPQMTVVSGRILRPPGIIYRQGTPVVDDRARWNLRDVKFAKGGDLKRWAVLVIKDGGQDEFEGPDDPQLRNLVNDLAIMCRRSGMNVEGAIPQYDAVHLPPERREDPIRAQSISTIREVLRKFSPKPTLVLIILANGDKHVYSGIKHICDTYLDIATICAQTSKIRKEHGHLQYLANLALKINMKMGGVNHALDPTSMQWLKQSPTMLVGMHVTHPGTSLLKGIPSIAAVVASVDHNFAQYPASLRIQETNKEMITSLTDMMHERLTAFRTTNNTLPDRILVYRAGVSESHFSHVIANELPAMKVAFKKFDTAPWAYNPKVTIVICGKRHRTRFYPTEASAADGNGNPRPGTVVDGGVTAVYEYDFFLQAHASLQGTTRPIHYSVVCDEIGFKADLLQQVTNVISYTFARATNAVSLVSPAYYADLACKRGRCYLHKLLQGVGDEDMELDAGAVWEEAERLWRNGVSGSLKETMFYL